MITPTYATRIRRSSSSTLLYYDKDWNKENIPPELIGSLSLQSSPKNLRKGLSIRKIQVKDENVGSSSLRKSLKETERDEVSMLVHAH